MNRRELATRKQTWAPTLARNLAQMGITPNMISMASIVFAIASGVAFSTVDRNLDGEPRTWLVAGAIGIQLRLLCNMLDGLLAIECGLKSKTGDLFNEIPDRVADIVILLGAGCAIQGLWPGTAIGWTAVLLAVLTAYVRLLGGSLGLTQDFVGPMAKQHRMFALTVGSLAAAIEFGVRHTIWSLDIALWIIIAGSAITIGRRTARIARELEAR